MWGKHFFGIAGLVVFASACSALRTAPAAPARAEPPPADDVIVVCGQRIPIGTSVVNWRQVPGYDAYRKVLETKPKDGSPAREVSCYQPGRVRGGEVLVEPGSSDLARLQEVVDQFVLHFDVCGVSQTCFKVLQERNLSVHFLLDIDGTIYQTLDLADQAWHATKANPRSIGIELANLGAYKPGAPSILDQWYKEDADGPYLEVPARLSGGGVRTPGFVARPARRERVVGEIQGERLEQLDFTPEQYAALAKLAAALTRVFPKIATDAPRASDGSVKNVALSEEEWSSFHGILGHYHVQTNKTDPGPAFDWERFLELVRARRAELGAVPRVGTAP